MSKLEIYPKLSYYFVLFNSNEKRKKTAIKVCHNHVLSIKEYNWFSSFLFELYLNFLQRESYFYANTASIVTDNKKGWNNPSENREMKQI